MELKLTNNEKCELLELDADSWCEEVREELFFREGHVMSGAERLGLQDAIGESLELEIETEAPQENTRLSFYTSNNKIIVIKKKRFDIKRFFGLTISVLGMTSENALGITAAIVEILMNHFFTILDEDASMVYSYLCYEYFYNGKRFDNTEIFEKVNQHLAHALGYRWPESKIREELSQLEDVKVIECMEGKWYVYDKIYLE